MMQALISTTNLFDRVDGKVLFRSSLAMELLYEKIRSVDSLYIIDVKPDYG